MALFKKEGSPFWWYDFRVAGKRYRGSTKQEVKGKARQIESAYIAKLSSGEVSELRTRSPFLSEFAPTFLSYIEAGRLEPKTVAYYKNGWRMLESLPIAGVRLDAITTASATTVNVQGSGSNVNCALRTLRRMLTVAVDMNKLHSAPRIRLAKEFGRERLITPEEEARLLAAAKQPLRDVFLLLLDTGMRPDEAVRLRRDSVDFAHGVILIPKGKSRQSRRHVPMSQRVVAMLQGRVADCSGFVFPSKRADRQGQPLTRHSVGASFRRLTRKLNIPAQVVLYSARHTFATDVMAATGDMSQTAKVLGHSGVAITQRYLHPATSNLGAIMDVRNAERHNVGHSSQLTQ